jgi:P27 family predicted phage terminase small subunit
MGARGPTPKPAWKQRLEGNPGKRPIKEEVEVDSKTPSCPGWLSETAKAEWARLAPELERLHVLKHLDRAVFAAYCQNYSEWAECESTLAERGRHYVAPGGRLRERPEVALAQQAQKRMLTFARDLALTPISRTRLSIHPTIDFEEDDDEWESLLD